MGKTTAVLGASDDPSRYSYKAVQMLQQRGYRVISISPSLSAKEDQEIFSSLKEVRAASIKVDTVTVYVRPAISGSLVDEIVELSPRRVIFNPGAENAELERKLRSSGIEVENACTLVLLGTGQF